MTDFLYSVHLAGFANSDLLRAIGSAITKRYEGSFKAGILLPPGK